jgi:hypothetical protein
MPCVGEGVLDNVGVSGVVARLHAPMINTKDNIKNVRIKKEPLGCIIKSNYHKLLENTRSPGRLCGKINQLYY